MRVAVCLSHTSLWTYLCSVIFTMYLFVVLFFVYVVLISSRTYLRCIIKRPEMKLVSASQKFCKKRGFNIEKTAFMAHSQPTGIADFQRYICVFGKIMSRQPDHYIMIWELLLSELIEVLRSSYSDLAVHSLFFFVRISFISVHSGWQWKFSDHHIVIWLSTHYFFYMMLIEVLRWSYKRDSLRISFISARSGWQWEFSDHHIVIWLSTHYFHDRKLAWTSLNMRWLRFVGSLKL